jgi:hypothetical protein
MLSLPLVTYRPRPGRLRRMAPPGRRPAALTLVAATLEKNRAWVRLRFDRAVDASGFVPAGVWVGVQPPGQRYDAAGPATLFNPQTVQVPLVAGVLYFGEGTRLTAPPTTGIVAADDGGTWTGADGLGLPFP